MMPLIIPKRQSVCNDHCSLSDIPLSTHGYLVGNVASRPALAPLSDSAAIMDAIEPNIFEWLALFACVLVCLVEKVQYLG